MSSATPEILLLNPPAEMPAEGTEAYDLLLKETGGASANPGFGYKSHIAATRKPEDYPDWLNPVKDIDDRWLPEDEQGKVIRPEEIIKPILAPAEEIIEPILAPIFLLNPPAEMPAEGTEAYDLLLKETGGASANPGFGYKSHIAATRKPEDYPDWLDPVKDIDDRWLPKDEEGKVIRPEPVPTPILLFNPPANMPIVGTEEYALLLQETGGASANPDFNYKSHIAATREPKDYPDWLDPVKDIDDRWLLKDHNGRAINPISLVAKTDSIMPLDEVKNTTNSPDKERNLLSLDGKLEDYRFSFDSRQNGELLIANVSENGELVNIGNFDKISLSGYVYNSQIFRDLALEHVGANLQDEVQRLYNSKTGNHMYSANQTEVDYLTGNENGWIAEGVSYKSDSSATQAVHRFFVDGKHFYTANDQEKNLLINSPDFSNYIYEGESHKVYGLKDERPEDAIAVKRYFNTLNGSHVYSSSIVEQGILSANPEYLNEGTAWYANL